MEAIAAVAEIETSEPEARAKRGFQIWGWRVARIAACRFGTPAGAGASGSFQPARRIYFPRWRRVGCVAARPASDVCAIQGTIRLMAVAFRARENPAVKIVTIAKLNPSRLPITIPGSNLGPTEKRSGVPFSAGLSRRPRTREGDRHVAKSSRLSPGCGHVGVDGLQSVGDGLCHALT